MASKSLIQAGNPLLKKKNKKILNTKSPLVKKILKDLIDTMHEADLIGIAAPQLGQNYAVFITHARNTKSRKLGKEDILRTYVNPKIVHVSSKENVIYEGCGSLDNGRIFGPVSRPSEVEVEALDESGEKFKIRCNGILARVIQHEMDHLSGIEFIAKVNDYSKVMIDQYYRKTVKNSALQKKNSQITKLEFSKV